GGESGCSAWMRSAKCTFQRQKSISSQAESISAWWTLLLCPRMVAALRRSRHGPLSRSAARRNTAARDSHGAVDHDRQASSAAATARVASAALARRRSEERRGGK